MPSVSVIVPVYNTANYLNKCLDSLVFQSLENIQIIIVNDGSTDNSLEIIDTFQKKYKGKIVVLNKENGGLSSARNFALPYVTGEYIGFVDSDDYVEKNMYRTMYDYAKQEDLDFVECDFLWEFHNKIKKDTGRQYLNNLDFFSHGRVMACNKIYKTDILINNNITFSEGLRYEDIEFFFKLIPLIKKGKLINYNFYHYIQRENSIINSQNEKNADIFIILNNILKFYKNNKIYNKYEQELEYVYIRFLLGSSFLRIVKIKDENIRKKILEKTINELYEKFPNWKNNNILRMKTNKKNFYYRSINKFTYQIYSEIFRIF